MNILKSHFWYHKRQRNGIFFLAIVIIGLLIAQNCIDFSSNNQPDIPASTILAFQAQIDSLKNVEIENRKPKIYPFNPNYISDKKGLSTFANQKYELPPEADSSMVSPGQNSCG